MLADAVRGSASVTPYNRSNRIALDTSLHMPDSAAAIGSKLRTIVIVHGLWMTGMVFALQRAQLVRRGYRVRTFSYPSLRLGLDEIAAQLSRFIATMPAPGVHLVGHSLGGLVVMHTLALFPQL